MDIFGQVHVFPSGPVFLSQLDDGGPAFASGLHYGQKTVFGHAGAVGDKVKGGIEGFHGSKGRKMAFSV